ncbi:MAG TPA: di-heme oxidoredictase family protein [Thermoanaerobaculia bacterium]|nr:di-heme oxidoredictase family protein [Thermoanaerobaculia bacterium]
MGDLGDGITQGNATGRLMRTAPLWGLRSITTLLHDGRATTVEQAILAHDGQGRKARDRFTRMTSMEKSQLLAFLGSL